MDLKTIIGGLGAVAETRAHYARGTAPRVRMLAYAATDRCNAKCAACDVPLRRVDQNAELNAEDFRSIFSDRGFSRLETVRVTGGEPFLKSDLTEICLAIRERTPLKILHITTNGSFPKRTLSAMRALADGKLNIQLQISMDGSGAEQDRMRGLDGIFETNLQLLRDLKKLRNQTTKFQFGINQTILPGNLGEMERVAALAREFECTHHILLGHYYHEGKNENYAPTDKPLPFIADGDWTEDGLREFYRRSRALRASANGGALKEEGAYLRHINELYLTDGGQNRLLHNLNRPKPVCTAFFSHFRLTPTGDLISCSARKEHVVGNLKETSFSELWNSEAAAAERRAVKACPGCWSECDITPSIFYSGDIIGWWLKNKAAPAGAKANL